ncbi:MAG: hypothetical protein JKY56_25475 [Kofleriaceae bacterium]|nr:hypothetical protein [Kofleriaceae bacterium]
MKGSLNRVVARVPRLRKRRGKVLAVKWGLNPNSSSLGVDVTFLLLGATALSVATPIVSAMVRLRLSRLKGMIKNPDSPEPENHLD